jgi:hypothetical protein
MIRGCCLCGGVKFEIRGSKGPFELCKGCGVSAVNGLPRV